MIRHFSYPTFSFFPWGFESPPGQTPRSRKERRWRLADIDLEASLDASLLLSLLPFPCSSIFSSSSSPFDRIVIPVFPTRLRLLCLSLVSSWGEAQSRWRIIDRQHGPELVISQPPRCVVFVRANVPPGARAGQQCRHETRPLLRFIIL